MMTKKDMHICNLRARVLDEFPESGDDREYNEALATRVGNALGDILMIPKDSEIGRWQTQWGNKSSAGLARTVFAILDDGTFE